MKLSKILLASTLILGFASTSLVADVVKGQKAYIKFLKEPCGMDGAKFALKHLKLNGKNKS